MSVFVIAEGASAWWNGPDESEDVRLERMRQLVDAAARAGADAFKIQVFRADRMYPMGTDHWSMLKKLEVPYDWLPKISVWCELAGIEFMASCFDEESVDAADPWMKRWKIASLEITDLSLLRVVARKGKPIVLSTGAATREQWLTAWTVLQPCAVTLMHCTVAYPCDPDQVNVGALRRLRWQTARIGLSDHTLDPVVAPVMAVALGATVIEKHFTLSRQLVGPDHIYALEPAELKQMVSAVRLAERMLGDGLKHITPSELQWVKWQHKDGGVRGG